MPARGLTPMLDLCREREWEFRSLSVGQGQRKAGTTVVDLAPPWHLTTLQSDIVEVEDTLN